MSEVLQPRESATRAAPVPSVQERDRAQTQSGQETGVGRKRARDDAHIDDRQPASDEGATNVVAEAADHENDG